MTPVTILLCTYNGSAHLQQQLESYATQTHTAWRLMVSDDGSTDETLQIVEAFDNRHPGRVEGVLKGPQQGPAANFLHLLHHPSLPDGPVAISDQDDVWLPHKLDRAMQQLPTNELAIYGAQSIHVRDDLTEMGPSQPPRRPAGLENALVQNVVSGHSLTLNAPAVQAIRRAGPPPQVAHHDWWLYLIVSALGGRVIIDSDPVLLYRQHDDNVMGANRGPMATISRAAQVLGGDYRHWVRANLEGLSAIEGQLPQDTIEMLAQFKQATSGPLGLHHLRRSGVYRQSHLATWALYVAAVIGRL